MTFASKRIAAVLALSAVIVTIPATAQEEEAGGVAPEVASSHSVSPSVSPGAEAAPKCANRPPPTWVTKATDSNDGVVDPAGRIVFGQIAYVHELLGPIAAPLFAMDADGSDLVQVLDCEVSWPSLSPDGSRLALSVMMDDGSKQVATSAPDGSDLRILTTTAGYADTPAWAPDGTWLIYSNMTEPCLSYPACTDDFSTRPTLWRVEADGSGERPMGIPPRSTRSRASRPTGGKSSMTTWIRRHPSSPS